MRLNILDIPINMKTYLGRKTCAIIIQVLCWRKSIIIQ